MLNWTCTPFEKKRTLVEEEHLKDLKAKKSKIEADIKGKRKLSSCFQTPTRVFLPFSRFVPERYEEERLSMFSSFQLTFHPKRALNWINA